MFKEFFVLLLFAHLLGDFYGQPESLAEKKQKRIGWVFLHALLYWAANLLVSLPVISLAVFIFSSISAFTHLIVDILKYTFTHKRTLFVKDKRIIFFIDQILHLFLIAIIAFLFSSEGNTLLPLSVVTQVGVVTGLQPMPFLMWVTVVLALHKPAILILTGNSKIWTLSSPITRINTNE